MRHPGGAMLIELGNAANRQAKRGEGAQLGNHDLEGCFRKER